jgi:hypothetical protein
MHSDKEIEKPISDSITASQGFTTTALTTNLKWKCKIANRIFFGTIGKAKPNSKVHLSFPPLRRFKAPPRKVGVHSMHA